MATASINIAPATRRKLARMKRAGGLTYDELLNKLLALVPEGDDEGRYSADFRLGLVEAELDARAGRVFTHAEVKKRLGLK